MLFPGALGDFICFLPTLLALRAEYQGRIVLAAAPAVLDLICLDETSMLSIHGREISELFAPLPSPGSGAAAWLGSVTQVYSWTGFHDADFRRRLEEVTGRPASLHPFRGMRAGEHAADYYARCVGLLPRAIPPGVIRTDDDWVSALRSRRGFNRRPFLVVHPGSGSPKKNWQGFGALARNWQQQHDDAVVVLHGSAEREKRDAETRRQGDSRRLGDGLIVVEDLSLPQVASLLRHSARYLGNDSGISHLAGAVGARGVVVFGPSDPVTWAPRSDGLRVMHAPEPCAQCGPEVFCVHRLSAEAVARAVAEV